MGGGRGDTHSVTTAMAHLAASNKGGLLCCVVLCFIVCGPINVAETSEDCDLKAQSEAAGITKPKILNIFTCGEATQVNG